MPSREDRCQKIGDPKETKAITAVCSLFTTTSSRPVVYPTQGPMPAPLKRLEFTVLTNGTGVVTFHHLAAGKVLYSLWLQKSKTTIFNSSGSSDEVAEGIYSGDGHFWVAIADEIQVGRGGSDATLVRLQREMPALSVQRLYFRSVPFSAEWKIHTPY
ncbi:uncharacterized protein LOC110974565 [Acanthaster planci]|uniref:Uncharacterized protein LOC110974565 n=1 Tax=Acanthaster planci TaxID=133434 RepID=A0A8B7XMF6_ACAPL|nr:uncharacterized protein LOC110974565 [Acanthaster planci]